MFVLPTLMFYALKFSVYNPTDSSYQYVLSGEKVAENTINFSTWVFNYPHGWQMGMPLPTTLIYKFLVVLNFFVFVLSFVYIVFKKNHNLLFACLWIIAGLIPFFFLNRVLVYYLNVSLFGFITVVVLGLQSVSKQSRLIASTVLLFIISSEIYMSHTIKNQWLEYSFVANAEETAKNFNFQVIQSTDWTTINQLCMYNLNGDANWAINAGNMARLYTTKDFLIHTSPGKSIQPACFQPETLLIENDARKFIIKYASP
jgi:hypothetical protein